jgi:tetratricopeptide (TPR) repeat protein
MILALTTALLIAQSAASTVAGESTLEEDRLALCQQEARNDPGTAMVTASRWLSEASGAGRSAPQQCLGFLYTSLLRWEAAESAFLAARDALLLSEHAGRARLAAMAGNAALAGGRNEAALSAFDLARQDARVAGTPALAGSVEADRARALVALGRAGEATEALARARQEAPQDSSVWLLSATLSRRLDRLEEALGQIRAASALAPDDPAIGLEAGLIAALSGQDEAAETSWRAVVARAPGSPEAAMAQDYLAQFGAPAEIGR